ncbi:hypothetical protein LCGC14_0643010 [marine sediment metagenome]|uniref:Hint domain-containing protein n=1 Tax=marine sediment metagenome TaxID=412755 RepID=A0A0F9TK74_9ZZZZ
MARKATKYYTKKMTTAQIEAEEKRVKLKLIENLEWENDYQKKNPIYFFDAEGRPGPNPRQKDIIEAWLDPFYKTFTFTGGERCLGSETKIYDPVKKENIEISEIQNDFNVLAWDGKKLVIAYAMKPFKKYPVETIYEIELSSRKSFTASAGHRILTPFGYRAISELRPGYVVGPHQSNLESFPSIPPSGVRNWQNTAQGFQSDCQSEPFYDEQPHPVQDNGQYDFPLQGDALKHIFPLVFGHSDGQDNRQDNIRLCQLFPHLSIQGGPGQACSHMAETLSHVSCRSSKRVDFRNLSDLLPIYEYVSQSLSSDGFSRSANRASCTCYSRDSTCDSPLGENDAGSSSFISSIKPIREDVKYDFHVPVFNNYYAGGAIHHNSGKTTILTLIGLSVMWGEYPWDNKDSRKGGPTKLSHLFTHNKPRKIRYIGQDWKEHIQDVVIPALELWWPNDREVKRKGNGIIPDAEWIDVKTGSSLTILSNNQKPRVHRGWEGDLILYDEPPGREIYIANARGLVDRRGREFIAATLLEEPWINQTIIKKRLDDGRPDPSVFNTHIQSRENVGYGITQEGLDEYANKLDPTERKSRLEGVPSYLEGIIYSDFKRDVHLIERFELPYDYVIDISIDTHPREKQAVLFTATSPMNEKFVFEEIWDNGDGKWIGGEILKCLEHYKIDSGRVNRVICDPLAKGDANNTNTVFDNIQMVLYSKGIALETASKDLKSGIIKVKEYLKGPNNKPSIFFFNDLIRTLFEIEGYMWDKETAKPVDKDDHMMENLYRILLLDTQWYDATEYEQGEDEHEGDRGRSAVGGY